MSSFIEKYISELPEHILRSNYYKGLSEIQDLDKEIPLSFPQEIYKETLEINSSDDLNQVIISESYFGYDEETKQEIFKNANNYWLSSEEPISMPNPITFFARQVIELIFGPRQITIVNCMKVNYHELLRFALENNFPNRTILGGLYTNLYFAAANNSIECARIGLANGFEISKSAFETAIDRNHFEMVQLFVTAGFAKTSHVCKFSKNMQTLTYLIENGFELDINDTSLTNTFAAKGAVDCLEYSISRGCVVTDRICENAAKSGNVRCMEIAFSHSANRQETIVYETIHYDNLEAFVYAAENGVEITQASFDQLFDRHLPDRSKKMNITPAKVSKYINR